MRLTNSGDILSQENYHRVKSIALMLPRTGYGPSASLDDCLAHLRPLLYFLFSAHCPVVKASSSLLIATDFSLGQLPFHLPHGVTSVLTLQRSCLLINGFRIWPYCRLFIFTPLSQGKWLSCRLSPAQTSSTHIRLNSLKHSIFTPWPLAKNLTFFHNIDYLLRCPLSDLTAYCPSGTWLRLCLRKTIASIGFAFSEYLDSITLLSLGLSP